MSDRSVSLESTVPGRADQSADRAEPGIADRRPVPELLNCIEVAARHLGRAVDIAASTQHLPLPADGSIPLALLPRIAAAVGLKGRLIERRPSQMSGLYAPFVVLLDGEAACVVTAVDAAAGTVSLVTSEAPDEPRTIAATELDARATGQICLVSLAEPAPDAIGGQAAGGARHWLWGPLLSFWPVWLQIALAALVINLLALVFPLYTMNVYDRVIPNLAIPTLWALTAGVAIAVVFELLLRQLRASVLDHIGRRVDLSLSASLFEHIQALALAGRSATAGTIAHRLREFDSARDFFMSASIVAAIDALFIGIFIWVLWLIVGAIALVPLVAVITVIAVTLLIQLPMARAVRRAQQHAGSRHSILVETLGGTEAIKAAGAERLMQRRWEEAVAANAKSNSAVRFWSQAALNTTASIQQAVGVAILVWGVYLVADGSITVGGLIAANILAGRALAPLANIAATLARAEHAFAAVRGIDELVALPRERGISQSGSQAVERGAVTFADVTFQYPGGHAPALRDATFTIEPGERVGIVGRVGSGKTTIGRLLAAFYAPDSGKVLVDGYDVRSYGVAALRRGVGFVGQEAELFTGTLRDNIVMGLPGASDADIAEVARMTGVARFAAASPLGLSTPVGERGMQLSGGQRQAVALARVLLRRPRILFLDEPTSAMDTTTEAELIANLRTLARSGITLLISSHRLPILDLADRLIVLDGGRVAADGPKAKVLDALKSPRATPAER